jgi:hypothetical protein
MEEKKNNSGEQQKLSYEELNTACAEMSQQLQNQEAYIRKINQEAQRMNYALQARKFEYVMSVIEYANRAIKEGYKYNFNKEFIESCLSEIENDLTPPSDINSENNKEEK